MKNFLKWKLFLLLTGLAILPLFDLFRSGLPVTHDGQDHVARIANFYNSLSDGVIIPRWASNLNWGYGHPILMFLYPFPSYVGSVFHFLGFSFVDSTKLVFATAAIASFFAMYAWVATSWGRLAGVLAAVLYLYAPYRFVDLYVRGAIGEHMAFVFSPLVCLGLLYLARGKFTNYASIFISCGMAGLILSHNALSLMFLPIIVLYGLYLACYEAKYRVQFIVGAVVLIVWGFTLSAFFWIPAFFEGKYTLRDIVTTSDFRNRFVPWDWFVKSIWNYGGGNEFSKYLGTAQLVSLGIAVWSLRVATTKARVQIIGALFVLVVSLFLMTSNALSVWNTVTLLQKFQFPWRLLSVTVFLLSMAAALGTTVLPQKMKRWVVGLVCLLAIVSTSGMWHAKQYRVFPENYFTSIYKGTTDTGESSPIWSIRFMEHMPNATIEVITGNATIRTIKRTTTEHIYEINVLETARLVENTLYFPGWVVRVDGKPIDIQFQDPAFRGLMTFILPAGRHVVGVNFGNTNLRKYADLVSLCGFVLFGIFLGTMRLWHPKIRQFRWQ